MNLAAETTGEMRAPKGQRKDRDGQKGKGEKPKDPRITAFRDMDCAPQSTGT